MGLIMEISKRDKLALAVAFDKVLNDKKDGILTELKSDMRNELLGLYEAHGVDRIALTPGGKKVGEVGLSFSKPRPSIKGEMMKEALSFLYDNDLAEIVPKRGWEEHFTCSGGEIIFKDTGEIVDWALWNEGYAKTASVRGCKPQDVLDAMAPMLNGTDVTKLFLEG